MYAAIPVVGGRDLWEHRWKGSKKASTQGRHCGMSNDYWVRMLSEDVGVRTRCRVYRIWNTMDEAHHTGSSQSATTTLRMADIVRFEVYFDLPVFARLAAFSRLSMRYSLASASAALFLFLRPRDVGQGRCGGVARVFWDREHRCVNYPIRGFGFCRALELSGEGTRSIEKVYLCIHLSPFVSFLSTRTSSVVTTRSLGLSPEIHFCTDGLVIT